MIMHANFKTVCFFALSGALFSCSPQNKQWTEQEARTWGRNQAWIVGSNYIPASAINPIEMWSDATYDHNRIDFELNLAEDLGFNTMRVYLSSVVYAHDPSELKSNMDDYLSIADKHGIRTVFVLFDDCWNEESHYGLQPEPKPGVHNSGWIQDPPVSMRKDTLSLFIKMERYLKDILATYKNDERILMWNLYNEPGNEGHGLGSLPLLKNAFRWAQEVRPSQPLTSGVRGDCRIIQSYQLAHSDVISYHGYKDAAGHQAIIDALKSYNRPIICTEYMGRTINSTFMNNMPVLRKNNVGALNWGLVAGKTGTIYAWNSWKRNENADASEPDIWFHDIFRQDGTPYSQEEVRFIKSMTRK